jgi:DNA-binding response OmpR family regulator
MARGVVSGERCSRALVIEDDPAVAEVLRHVLADAGYQVAHAPTARRAKALLSIIQPDLILLDLILPDADGLILCADLRSHTDAPIIVCSGTKRRRDLVLALRLGADAFLPKPFDLEELLSRIEAVRRRVETGTTPPWGTTTPAPIEPAQPDQDPPRVGPLSLSRDQRGAMLAGEPIPLTAVEFRLLACLMRRPDEVLSRRVLAQQFRQDGTAGTGRSIDVYVHRLRVKLQTAQDRTGIAAPPIISIRGVGYRLSSREPATMPARYRAGIA